ncbi:hypothetical protein KUF71_003121 [Frankliniella fusca]|uniref:Thyroid adenoma-associated protein homolog n=1 Tax=Frankliniella fusca TaxID=407009 RepID=A0AAE1GRQ2_9NEOP|nr:hypothetical protein KUF71_003121 [Frankliniella fusca]
MPGPGAPLAPLAPPTPGPPPQVDVDALLAEARVYFGDDGSAPLPAKDPAAAEGLLQLLLKEPHRVSVKHDYHVLRCANKNPAPRWYRVVSVLQAVVSGTWGERQGEVVAAPALASASAPTLWREQALLLALVLAARLPLDGLLLTAQALFHALPDAHILPLLVAMESLASIPDSGARAPARTRRVRDVALALHHGLLASALALVPPADGAGLASPEQQQQRRPGLPTPAGPALRQALVAHVLGAARRLALREARDTSHRTKAAFRMLHIYLCTLTQWRCLPAGLAEIEMLVSTSWEVPLPGVREHTEAVLVQLLDVATQSWAPAQASVAQDSAAQDSATQSEALERLRSTEARWSEVLHRTSWRVKDKYLRLKVLAPRVPRAALLRDVEAVLLDGLLVGMADPHLASAATAVYRVLLAGLLTKEDWVLYCLPTVRETMRSGDRQTYRILLDAMKAPLAAAMANEDSASYGHAAYIHLLKIGRKDGFWDVQDAGHEVGEYWAALEWGSRHADSWVRGAALAAVCVSSRPRQAVTEREARFALRFLEVNARADDTRLRHALLEALGWLLMRLRNSVRALLALPAGDTEDNEDLAVTARVLADLHRFVLDGLQPGTNYQRRATCLGVYRLLLSYLAPASGTTTAGLKKAVAKDPLPASRVLDRHLRLGSVASRRVLLNCIMDPADDVRSKAAEVLAMLPATEQAEEEEDSCRFLGLPTWDHILLLCNSRLFFQAESGAVLGSVLCSWDGSRVQPLQLVAECERQLRALRDDVLAAASGGSPLHGLLGLVRRLLPARGPRGRRPAACWAGTEDRLLLLLEANVDLCLNMLACRASADTAFNPSFAEMGEAIDSIVSRPGRPGAAGEDGDDDGLPLTLSPAHQLVLNCIWLNLKMCCVLASDLLEVDWQGEGAGTPQSQLFAERCARLPVSVLLRCRHKGAIEAAGAALQQVVKTLTDQSDMELRELPHRLLMEFLHLLLEGSTAKGTSVSRRSAGMAILVHRIVLGDQQPDKPLLHECISNLFNLLESSASHAIEDAQHDLPQTQALHFLRTLVADAALRVAMSPYLGQSALFCFRHLNSSLWSIRNASLQLFGALVPKIVGQGKNPSDSEEEDDSIVGCIQLGDLIVRFPPLCNLLLEILESSSGKTNILQSHAELIPALSLLARLSVSEVPFWSAKYVQKFKGAFLYLLSSPIATVRSLAAKGISRFTPLMESADAFEDLSTFYNQQNTENGRFGVLVAMKLIKDHLSVEGYLTHASESEQLKIASLICNQLLSQQSVSFASESILLSILAQDFDFGSNSDSMFKKISSLMEERHVGVSQWVLANLRMILCKSSVVLLPGILEKSLDESCCTDIARATTSHLMKRIDERTPNCVLQEILDITLRHLCGRKTLSNYETFHLLNLVLKIISLCVDRKISLLCDIDLLAVLSQSIPSGKFGARCEAVTLPVISGLLSFLCTPMHYVNPNNTLNNKHIEGMFTKVLHQVQNFSCPEIYGEDFRLAAATALRFIGVTISQQNFSYLKQLSFSPVRPTALILKAALQLLQDEDSLVREEASKFVILLSHNAQWSLNSLECLSILLTLEFLCGFLGSRQEVLLFLWDLLAPQGGTGSSSKENVIENPFDHGTRNIFAEEIWVVDQIQKILSCILIEENVPELFCFPSCNEDILFKWCSQVKEEMDYFRTLTKQATKKRVREECEASAAFLQIKKIDYKMKFLKTVASDRGFQALKKDQYLVLVNSLKSIETVNISLFSFFP